MKSEELHIGGGFARFGQLLFPIFLSLLLIPIIIITINDFSINSVSVLIIILLLSLAIIKWLYLLSDVYLKGDLLISYKLFSRKEVQIEDIFSIKKSRLPLTMTLKTTERKIRFQIRISDFPKYLLSSDKDILLKELESTIYSKNQLEKNENAL